jgi:hypothetical protein
LKSVINIRCFAFRSEFYTVIKYMVKTMDGDSIPVECFNPNLIEPIHSLCDRGNKYLGKMPAGYFPSYIDLKGNHSENFATMIISALQQMGIHGKGKPYRIVLL